MRAALAMIVAGWIYGLTFPPHAWSGLAWIVLVPVIVVARCSTPRRALAWGALFAVAGTCATVDWLPRTVAVYYGQPMVIGVGLFAAVTLLMVVPPVATFALVTRLVAGVPSLARPLVVAAAWVATELWRAHAFGGNPWVLFGYSQARILPIVQVADLAGVYGVGFLLVAANAALADVALALGGRSDWPAAGRSTAAATLVVVACLAYGIAALDRTDGDTTRIPVAVVQGNLDLGSQWREELFGRNLDVYLRLTLEELRRGRAKLVVWPEATMTFFLARERLYQAAIGQVLEPFGAELVAGGPYAFEGAEETYANSAFALEPSGAIRARYDKERLLPFAEYFPFPRLDFLRRSFGRVRSFVPGAPTPPLPTVAGAAGVLICNEAMFPDLARARVREGARVLLALTNDTWVGDPKFAEIAFDMAVLRAVETRRYLVRASTSGPSGVVTPTGVVAAVARFGTSGVALGDVAPRSGLTVYARVGDVFATGCALVTALAVFAALRRRAGPPGTA